MVELQFSKLLAGVRFSYPAHETKARKGFCYVRDKSGVGHRTWRIESRKRDGAEAGSRKFPAGNYR